MNRVGRVRAWLRTHRAFVVFVVVFVLVVVVVAAATGIWMRPDAWGALGQWCGAAATVLAVAAALYVPRAEVVNQAKAHAQAQARLVCGVLIPPNGFEDPSHEMPWSTVRITNYGAQQVIGARVEGFVLPDGKRAKWQIADIDPQFGTWDEPETVIGPGSFDSVPVEFPEDVSAPVDYNSPYRSAQPVIGFTDADGQRWRRIGWQAPTPVLNGDTFSVDGPDWYRFGP